MDRTIDQPAILLDRLTYQTRFLILYPGRLVTLGQDGLLDARRRVASSHVRVQALRHAYRSLDVGGHELPSPRDGGE